MNGNKPIIPNLRQDFMTDNPNIIEAYNDDYILTPKNLNEIKRMADLDRVFDVLFGDNADPSSAAYKEAKEILRVREIEALLKNDPEKMKEAIESGRQVRYAAGETVPSPWGNNKVDFFESKEENGVEDICIKTIVVDLHRQLSLQKHRGREEIWAVEEGTLTVNLNDKVYRVSAEGIFDITDEKDLVNGKGVAVELDGANFGKNEAGHHYIYLAKGSVHAMNNVHEVPVRVNEIQKGLTYEADNDRLAEALENKDEPRATIPLISKMEVTAKKENFLRIEAANAPYWDNGRRFAQQVDASTKPKNVCP